MTGDRFSERLRLIIIVIGCAMVLYHLASTQYLIWGSNQHQAFHLGLALTLVFLDSMANVKKRKLWPLMLIFLLAGLAVIGYILFRMDYLERYIGFIPSALDLSMGIILVVVVFESTRQAWGLALPIVCAIFILYFFFGYLAPGPFAFSHFDPEFVLSMLGIGLRGVFAYLSISANFIFLFIVFGSLMAACGGQKFFMHVGRAAGRVLAGGAAQTSVVSSLLVGMVMGQAVSNVIVTGSFTIPLMKRMGYTREQAGAVEAASSTGGQVMPPVMGESVFIMAALINMAYIDIATRSFIGGFLFFMSVGFAVQFMASKSKIPRPRDPIEVREMLNYAPVFLVPLIVIMIFLYLRFTPMYAAFFAIITAIVVPFLNPRTRISLRTLVNGMTDGAVAGAKVAVAVALIGTLVQTVTATGVGVTIANVVEAVSGGNLWVALLITMLLSLFLGMGLPTPAAYLVVAVIVVPVLTNLGAPLLAAHLFAFWFAIFSALTPPVAFASMAASSLAGGSYVGTSIVALKLAFSAFIIPYLIVAFPILTLGEASALAAIMDILTTVMLLIGLAALIFNYGLAAISHRDRLLLISSSGALVAFGITKIPSLFIAGLVLFLFAALIQWRKSIS